MAKTTYTSRTWVDDLVGGFDAGNKIGAKIGERAEARKTSKEAAIITNEQDNKLFKVEDKGALGNWLYDTLGIGDPPKKTPKGGPPAAPQPGTATQVPPAAGTPGAAAPQANAAAQPAPPSEVRARVASGLNLAQAAGESAAPAELILPEETTVDPVRPVAFAAATPPVASPAPAMSPTVGPPGLSALQQAMLAYGIKPSTGARV